MKPSGMGTWKPGGGAPCIWAAQPACCGVQLSASAAVASSEDDCAGAPSASPSPASPEVSAESAAGAPFSSSAPSSGALAGPAASAFSGPAPAASPASGPLSAMRGRPQSY